MDLTIGELQIHYDSAGSTASARGGHLAPRSPSTTSAVSIGSSNEPVGIVRSPSTPRSDCDNVLDFFQIREICYDSDDRSSFDSRNFTNTVGVLDSPGILESSSFDDRARPAPRLCAMIIDNATPTPTRAGPPVQKKLQVLAQP